MESNAGWSLEIRNILAEDVCSHVRDALSADWVVGLHLYLGGGRSGDTVAFSDYDDFISYVEGSRPGDLFVLWSVAELRRKEQILVDCECSVQDMLDASLIQSAILDQIRPYLAAGTLNEVLVLVVVSSGDKAVLCLDLDGLSEKRFLSAIDQVARLGGSICVLPLSQIDSSTYYLFKGKRPNSKGEVPIGGAY